MAFHLHGFISENPHGHHRARPHWIGLDGTSCRSTSTSGALALPVEKLKGRFKETNVRRMEFVRLVGLFRHRAFLGAFERATSEHGSKVKRARRSAAFSLSRSQARLSPTIAQRSAALSRAALSLSRAALSLSQRSSFFSFSSSSPTSSSHVLLSFSLHATRASEKLKTTSTALQLRSQQLANGKRLLTAGPKAR